MPVTFLTPQQQQRYGRYHEEPVPEQLNRYFYLDDADRQFVRSHRGDHNVLGVALQLGTVRFLNTFISDPTAMPPGALTYVANQLDLPDTNCLLQYRENRTHWAHAAEIRQRYGYHAFTDQPGHFRLVRWLFTRAWLSAERPSVLFDLATARCVEQKILLPGVSVLTRLVAQVRDRAAARLWRTLAAIPSAEQRSSLLALLDKPADAHHTPLDDLRSAPTRISAPALVSALRRMTTIRALGLRQLDLSRIPVGQLKVLARYAAAAWAPHLRQMREERKVATLLAFGYIYEAVAQDDALDLLDQLFALLLMRAKQEGEQQRLRTIGDMDSASLQLKTACEVLCDPTCEDPQVRAAVFARIPREQLLTAIAIIAELSRPPDERYYEQLLSKYRTIRRFMPTLLTSVNFAATVAAKPALEAWQFLQQREQKPRPRMRKAPLAVVNRAWRHYVFGARGAVDKRFYSFCVLEQLLDGLRRRDVYVTPSERWGDPRTKLLQGAAWEAVRVDISRTLGRSLQAEEELAKLSEQLDAAYRRTAENLPGNAAVRIEQVKGRDSVVLTGLDKLDEPASLVGLRTQVQALLPLADLPDVLLEIEAQTGFAQEFRHISERHAHTADLSLSICAVLLAEACNIGLEPLVRREVAALTFERLSWVQQNYIRADTIARANARLVDAQTRIPLARAWGGGEVASADGLRFVVPVRTINARPNRKYFPAAARGVTYYNYTSDQFTGFHGIVIPGTLRDSLFILDGLLEQVTSLRPQEIMTDTAGYSDVVFGLFYLLGYQFSPRLADIGATRFWRIDRHADYGALQGLARQRVNTQLIARHWDDLLRVAGSLKLGALSASELLRTFQRGSRTSTLGRAIGELGRIAKSLHLLAYLDDESYRRRILTQLNRGEARHRLARVVFYGQKGELRQRYREGQEDQLSALGLVLNILVLWNTQYMDRAVAQIRASGGEIKDEDMARLSPLVHKHLHLLGRYHFALPEAIQRGELRPLRKPDELRTRS